MQLYCTQCKKRTLHSTGLHCKWYNAVHIVLCIKLSYRSTGDDAQHFTIHDIAIYQSTAPGLQLCMAVQVSKAFARHCNTVQHCATLCNTVQHCATLCNTVQHCATLCNTVQHSLPLRTSCRPHLATQTFTAAASDTERYAASPVIVTCGRGVTSDTCQLAGDTRHISYTQGK